MLLPVGQQRSQPVGWVLQVKGRACPAVEGVGAPAVDVGGVDTEVGALRTTAAAAAGVLVRAALPRRAGSQK